MIKIFNNLSQYNENVLSSDFTFENNLGWTLTVGGGSGATISNSTENHYQESKALKITHPTYDLNEITIIPTNPTDYVFTVPRTGKYIFSIRTLIKCPANNLPEVFGGISFYANGAGVPFKTFSLMIGNNSLPNFTFNYNKWETFYEDVQLVAGDTISLSIHIENQPSHLGGLLEIFFDAFKLEYIQDKIYELPTYYTKPI